MNLLQKIANWFQPTYNSIDKWDLPPALKAKVNQVWVNLPADLQIAIWKLIKAAADKYGDALAQQILEGVINALKKI